jgi:hypothetical protein
MVVRNPCGDSPSRASFLYVWELGDVKKGIWGKAKKPLCKCGFFLGIKMCLKICGDYHFTFSCIF